MSITPTASVAPSATASATLTPMPPPGPTATPEPPAPYPAGTRTGTVIVDQVLDAVESGDATSLARLVDLFPRSCTDEPGIGAVMCNGLLEGTQVQVVGSSNCEGSFRPESEAWNLASSFLGQVARFDGALFAVTKAPPFSSNEGIPGDYRIVFTSGQRLALSEGGITYFSFGCAVPGQNFRRELDQIATSNGSFPDYILPPLP